ncbi:MAG: glycosyltransferase family 4 protein [Clostridia bacterium]
MNILVVCQYYYPEEFRINDICETLAKNNSNKVTCLTGLPNYPKGKVEKDYKWFRRRKENINGVKVLRCFEIGRRKGMIFRILNYISYMISASFKALFLGKNYDVIYVYQLSPILMAIPAIIYKKIYKKKLVLYCLDLWPDSVTTFGISEKSFIYKIIDKISRKIYNNSDSIIVSSESFIEEIREKVNNKNKIIYMPQYTEETLKKSEYINRDTFNFVFAGNIGKAQSVETIIKAANIVKENKKIKIYIVGDGSTLNECKDLAIKLNLNNIEFCGRKKTTEIQEYYDMADAMIVTLSKDKCASKTLPGKVQTCMATGNAIIAAADGETKNIINKAKCGWCADAEDYNGLAKHMEEFTRLSREERKQLRENSYTYYQKNYLKENFINKLQEILKKEGTKNV